MHPSSPMARKFKAQPAAGKFTLMSFRDLGGPIFEHCQERGGRVNSECYCALLTNELKPAICTRQRGQLLQSVILQHNNTSALTAHKYLRPSEVLNLNSWNILLTVQTTHLATFKKMQLNEHFSNDEELKNVVRSWLLTP
jgi:hypothetical protein